VVNADIANPTTRVLHVLITILSSKVELTLSCYCWDAHACIRRASRLVEFSPVLEISDAASASSPWSFGDKLQQLTQRPSRGHPSNWALKAPPASRRCLPANYETRTASPRAQAPDCLRWTCMLVCVFCAGWAHETAGAARIRLSLRPLVLFRGWQSTQSSGASRRDDVDVRPHAVLNLGMRER
jgi:hypothetical protein